MGGRVWAGRDPDQGESTLMSNRPENTRGENLRLMAAGFIGNVLEWYDFAVLRLFRQHHRRLISWGSKQAVGAVYRPWSAWAHARVELS
jgi:hypothetical protein